MSIEIRYIDTRDKWGLWVDGAFKNYVEESMVKQLEFATKVQAAATSLAGTRDSLADIVEVYFARGYDGSGEKAVKEEDLIGSGIAVADMTACITMFQQLANFFGNAPVAKGDYKTTINKMRNDI